MAHFIRWLWYVPDWTKLAEVATVFSAMLLLAALLYAGRQLREAANARNADLYLRLHENVIKDASWRVMEIVEDLKGPDYSEFRRSMSDEDADTLLRLCLDFCAMGHLLHEGYLDRGVVLEWIGPLAIHIRSRLDAMIRDLRSNGSSIFEHFDVLRDEAVEWERRHRRSPLGDFPDLHTRKTPSGKRR